MKNYLKLILGISLFVLLTACQTAATLEDPQPTQTTNRLSTSDFTTAENLFANKCQSCHNGYIAPDFNGHLPNFAKVENGKTYLINALLFGVQGPITANGVTFDDTMRNRSNDFDDTQIALLLNYSLTAWDNSAQLPEDFTLITAAEVATERQTPKTATDVYTARQVLQLP